MNYWQLRGKTTLNWCDCFHLVLLKFTCFSCFLAFCSSTWRFLPVKHSEKEQTINLLILALPALLLPSFFFAPCVQYLTLFHGELSPELLPALPALLRCANNAVVIDVRRAALMYSDNCIKLNAASLGILSQSKTSANLKPRSSNTKA